MLTLHGPRIPGRTCDGVSRRDFLRIGALGIGGLTLADLLRLKAQGAVRSEAAHKAVIMVYLPGGPSHIDMYDLKPDAPVEYRGEFKPIRTNVPGMDICELMPLQAKIADKFAILRGLKTQGNHDPTELLTGIPAAASGTIGSIRRPAFGCVVSKLRGTDGPIPPYVSVSDHRLLSAYDDPEEPAYLGARASAVQRPRAGHERPRRWLPASPANAWKIARHCCCTFDPCSATSTPHKKRWPAWTATTPAPWK